MTTISRRGFVLRMAAGLPLALCLSAERAFARFITASDGFGGADSTSSLGGNWTNHDSSNPMGILTGNAYTTTFGTWSAAFWNNTTFSADHYSQATIVDAGGGCLVTVRASGTTAGTQAFYALAGDPGGASIVYVHGTTMDVIAPVTGSVNDGNVAYLDVIGNAITAKIGGSTVGFTTDANITTGQPGIGSFGPGTYLDDWSAGDVVAGAGGSHRNLLLLGVGQ